MKRSSRPPQIPLPIEIGEQLMRMVRHPWTDVPEKQYFVVVDIWYDPTQCEMRRRYDRERGWCAAVLPIGVCGTPFGRARLIKIKAMGRQGYKPADRDQINYGHNLQEAVKSRKVVVFRKHPKYHK